MINVNPNWLKEYPSGLEFILFQASRYITPGILAIPTALAFPNMRGALKDKGALVAFCAVPFLWMFLIGWCAIFVGAMDGNYDSPWWADIPLYANVFGLPVVAAILIWRAKGARLISFGYALLNALAWLAVSLLALMAISGEWI